MQTVSPALNFRSAASYLRCSTFTSHAGSKSSRLIANNKTLTLEQRKERDEAFRKRKTEWKRRQGVRHNLASTNTAFTPNFLG